MNNNNHRVIETRRFVETAGDIGIDAEGRRIIRERVQNNPFAGDEIGDGVRKLRIGHGGGSRVVHVYVAVSNDETRTYLVSVYRKKDRADLTKEEYGAIRQMAGMIRRKLKGNNDG